MSASTGDPGEPAVALTVAGVARRLGVAPATLRTWDRRYGLGPSEHTAGAHRRYSAADLARLETMRRLVLEGVAPADAARAALAGEPSGRRRAEEPPPRARGGGSVIPLPGAAAAARGLARAVMATDVAAAAAIIRTRLQADGVVRTWDEVILPVLQGAGERFASTGRGVEVEHLLSETVAGVLGTVTRGLEAPLNRQPVLLAAAEEEQHTLALHAVAAGLAERGVGTRMLGMRVPPDALAAAVRRSGPVAVMVWAQTPGDDRGEELRALPGMRPAPVVVVGGQGWAAELPPGVERVHDLAGAVDRLAEVALLD